MKKSVKIISGVAAIAVLGGGFLFFQNKKPAKADDIKIVSLYQVEQQSPLHLKGQVQPKSTQTVLLNPEKGPVKTIHVKEGDHAAKGSILVTYEWGEKIKADRDSIVGLYNEDAKNDTSKPLLVLKSLDTEIKGLVTEYDKEKLQPNMDVTINYVNQKKSVPGNIIGISELAHAEQTDKSDTSKIVNYDFVAQPKTAIPVGYSVEILIPRNEYHLPTKSVATKEGKSYVYTIKDKKAHKQEVTVTQEDGYYNMTQGLKAGDKIIKNTEGLKDGMDVKVQ